MRGVKTKALAGAGISLGATLVSGTAEAADITVTSLNDSGAGSLRQAIIDANAAPTSDRILFQSTLSGQLTLASELPITGATEVLGPGPDRLTVSGNNSSRIFYVDTAPNTPVTISGLRLTGGMTVNPGGAISSRYSNLTIANAVISQNRATASSGGGISNFHGSLAVRSSTVSGNSAGGGTGGGIISRHGPSSPGLTIESSTITGNDATTGVGGGLAFYDDGGAVSPLSVSNSTISGNKAGNATVGGGGAFIFGGSSRTMVNTIVADNTAPVAPDIRTGTGGNLNAPFSLIENPSGATITGGPNITGQDPKLGPLADNGGPTPTQALNVGSPAIDQGQASGVDQRGAPRPFDFAGVALAGDNDADIGAYERVLCGKVLVNKVGTSGKDTIKGSKGADGILGLGGKDTLKGLAGKDGLCGGPGKDTLKGGAGNDTLLGQAGNDSLIGGKGKDKLKGGKGKDKQTQ